MLSGWGRTLNEEIGRGFRSPTLEWDFSRRLVPLLVIVVDVVAVRPMFHLIAGAVAPVVEHHPTRDMATDAEGVRMTGTCEKVMAEHDIVPVQNLVGAVLKAAFRQLLECRRVDERQRMVVRVPLPQSAAREYDRVPRLVARPVVAVRDFEIEMLGVPFERLIGARDYQHDVAQPQHMRRTALKMLLRVEAAIAGAVGSKIARLDRAYGQGFGRWTVHNVDLKAEGIGYPDNLPAARLRILLHGGTEF